MKIGIVVPGFSASERDWCIPAHLNLVHRLSERAEVHVFPLRYPHRRRSYRVHGASVHPQGGAQRRGWRRMPLLLRSLAAVRAEHRRGPFDVLHAICVDEPGFVAAADGLLLGVPSVLSLFGGELVGFPDIGYGGQLSRANRWLARVGLQRATRVTAGSGYLRRLAQPYVSPERLLSIPVGVDATRFHPRAGAVDPPPLAAGEIKLLHAASLVPVKGQNVLLRALERVHERVPDVHLHVLGDGPLREELGGLSESLGVGGRVTFHGAVPYEEMPAYYRAADLCVMASRHEGQELVTLEAGACGRATVGTAVGVVPDLVPRSCVAPVGDHRALAEVLVRVLQAPEVAVSLGRASLEAVRAGYTLERTVDAFMRLYGELAEERGRRPPI